MAKSLQFIINSTFLLLIILLFGTSNAISDDHATGEKLFYELTYSGLRIADISYSESDYYNYNGVDVKNFQCDVEAFSDLIKIGGKYRSIVAEDNSVRYYRSEQKTYDGKQILEYWFNYDKNNIRIKDTRIIEGDSTSRNYKKDKIDRKYSDSISLFFRLRESLDTLTTPVYVKYYDGIREDSILIESITPEIFELSETETTPVLTITAKIQAGLMPGAKDKIKLYLSDDENKNLIYGRLYMTLGYLELKLLSEF